MFTSLRRPISALSLALALALSFAAASQAAPDGAGADAVSPERKMLAAELLEVTGVQTSIEQTLAGIRAQQAANIERYIAAQPDPEGAKANAAKAAKLMEQELSWDKISADFIDLYAKTYSEEDLKGILEFYRSPLGKRMLENQAEIANGSQAIVRSRIEALIPAFQKALKGE
ncbi:MAG: DUF2059 domain-containing protein [Verrucomicrobiales bacterium]